MTATSARSRSRRLGTVGAALASAGIAHAFPSVSVLAAIAGGPGPERLGPLRLRGPRDRTEIALTFDDGPSPTTTPRILDQLSDLGLRATFFVSGTEVRDHPHLVQDIRTGGHGVECHGMYHDHHLLHGARWVLQDSLSALDALESVGVRPRFVRPPYGQASAGTLKAARHVGLVPVLWSCWGREFAQRSPDAVATRVIRGLEPGSIVLLHDSDRLCGEGSVAAVEGALPTIADECRRRGLRTVTVDELLS